MELPEKVRDAGVGLGQRLQHHLGLRGAVLGQQDLAEPSLADDLQDVELVYEVHLRQKAVSRRRVAVHGAIAIAPQGDGSNETAIARGAAISGREGEEFAGISRESDLTRYSRALSSATAFRPTPISTQRVYFYPDARCETHVSIPMGTRHGRGSVSP